jgi:CubicO group peptidase (beta-lactamase class C family)
MTRSRRAAAHTAAHRVLAEVAADPRYARTSHLHLRLDGAVVVDEHLRGPLRADVFSVTKSVLSTALAVMAARRLLPDLDRPVAEVLPPLRGTPAETHTWRQLLTMTRGAAVDGRWELDAVASLPADHVGHLAQAPQLRAPGAEFVYDNGAPHLLSAAATEVLGESVADFAGRELFAPLGILDYEWPTDPDGYPAGSDRLQLTAGDLASLGQLWLDGGRLNGRSLLDPPYFQQMTRAQVGGGPPEMVPYGFLLWVPDGMLLAGGWAGQHLLVIPAAGAVVVTTGYPGFDPGPPATDQMPPHWRPALDLVRTHLLPVLLDVGA